MSCSMLETLQIIFYRVSLNTFYVMDFHNLLVHPYHYLCWTRHIGIRIVTVWKPAWSELNFPKVGSKAAESWNCGYVMCTGAKRATQKQLIRNDNVTVYMRILFISHTGYGKWLVNDQFVWLCLKRNATGPTEHKPQETCVNKYCFQPQTELLLSSSRPVTVYRCANSFVKCAATFWIEAESCGVAQKSVTDNSRIILMPIQSYASQFITVSHSGEVYIQHGVRHVEQFLYLRSVSSREFYGTFIVRFANRRNGHSV